MYEGRLPKQKANGTSRVNVRLFKGALDMPFALLYIVTKGL